MATELPGYIKGWRKFIRVGVAYDFVLTPLAVVGACITSYGFFWNGQPVRGWITLIVAVVVTLLGILKAVVSFSEHSRKKSTHELEGCLHTLHALLTESIDENEADPSLRLTIHKPIDKGQRLEQVVGYVGASRSRPGSVGRTFPAQSGVIGVAFREKKFVTANRSNDDYETYVRELKEKWGYIEDDARALNPSSKSWMAVPLVETDENETTVHGIVYLDSTDPDFFTPERQVYVNAACSGIARFVKRRYS